MTALWLTAAALTAVVLAGLLRPLWRRPGPPSEAPSDGDLAVYRDQLAELDRDVERGLLDPGQAERAGIEIKRRLLAAAGRHAPVSPPAGRHRGTAAIIVVAITTGAFALYGWLGRPDVPDMPLATRPAEPPATVTDAGPMGGRAGVEEAVRRLRERLNETPDEPEGWALLGRSLLVLSRPTEAADALRRAVELAPRPPLLADYGEALAAADDGRIGEGAHAAFTAALAGDPRNVKARFYLALARAQRGDIAAALAGWIDLWALAPADAPWLLTVRRSIAQAAAELAVDPATRRPSADAVALGAADAAGPSWEALVAALPADERTAVLEKLVARLSARLAAAPDDRDGWLLLARAHALAGRDGEAAKARARAAAAPSR